MSGITTHYAEIKRFNEMYVLGDSLNDSGKGKSVTAGNINPTQTEILYQKLFHRNLKYYQYGGTNFSVWGNEVYKLVNLFNEKFDKNQIGNNNLFIVLVGNNDIATELELHPFHLISHDILQYHEAITTNLINLVNLIGNNKKIQL